MNVSGKSSYLRTPVTEDNHNVWLEWGGEDLQVEWEIELVDEVDNSKVWAGIKFPYNNDGKDEK